MSMKFEDHINTPEGFILLNRRVDPEAYGPEEAPPVWNIKDLYAAQYQAAEERVPLDDFWHKQAIHGVSVEDSLRNVREGRSTREFVRAREEVADLQRRRENRRSAIAGSWKSILPIAASLLLMASYSAFGPEPKYSSWAEYLEAGESTWGLVLPAGSLDSLERD